MSLELDIRLSRRDFELRVCCRVENAMAGVIGPSGSGKSSLFRVIAGLERSAAGRIALGNRVLADSATGCWVPPEKRRVGIVFQERHLFPHLSVAENLRFGLRYAPRQHVALESVVEMLQLEPLLGAFPHEISGGEAQRTALGRALLAGPELLLLDEPFSAVDDELRLHILPYLRQLRDEVRIPMLVISHDLPDIQRLTSQVLLIERGRLVGQGAVSDLLVRGSAARYLSSQRFVNVLELERPESIGEGAVAYRLVGHDTPCVVLPEPRGPRTTVVVAPSEIALSTEPVDHVSIQNQLPGTITRMRSVGARVLCHVNAGIPLVSEITPNAAATLRLAVGKRVWCLFKASAANT